jgi:hypothetical protein
MSESARRLTDLFVDLHETMDLEIKGWLDLESMRISGVSGDGQAERR